MHTASRGLDLEAPTASPTCKIWIEKSTFMQEVMLPLNLNFLFSKWSHQGSFELIFKWVWEFMFALVKDTILSNILAQIETAGMETFFFFLDKRFPHCSLMQLIYNKSCSADGPLERCAELPASPVKWSQGCENVQRSNEQYENSRGVGRLVKDYGNVFTFSVRKYILKSSFRH